MLPEIKPSDWRGDINLRKKRLRIAEERVE